MRAVYSKDVVDTIKSRPKGECVLYDAILSLAETEAEYGRSWKEVYPDIMMAYIAKYQMTYILGHHGEFRASEIMVLLGRVDLLRAMLSPSSRVVTLINRERSNMMSCAAWCNNVEIFKLSFNRYSPFFNADANTSIFYAVQNGSIEVLNALYEANVRISNSIGLRRSVNIAYSKGYMDIIKLMVSKFNVRGSLSLAMDNAIANNDLGSFCELYDESKQMSTDAFSKNIHVEDRARSIQSDLAVAPITTAAFMGSWDIVRFLFALGVPLYNNVGPRNSVYYGDTILHTIYNCHLPQDIEAQKPLISDIYNKLKSSLSLDEQVLFMQHFGIESKAYTH